MKQTILVTGAATGMGALSAVSLVKAGHTVYASMRDPVGRNAARVEELQRKAAGARGSLRIVELDVLSDASVARAAENIGLETGGVDVVIHNAAHLMFGVTEAFSPEEFIKAFDVNCVGAVRVNREFLPGMRQRRSGLLLWIGSGTTRVIPPFLGPYTAAKAALDALAESTAWDIAAYGIETTILMPGVFTVGTEHFAKAAMPADKERSSEYGLVAPFVQSSGEDTSRLFGGDAPTDPQIVADEVVRVVNLPAGSRPRRTVADGSDYGAEIINGAVEELRIRLAKRMHVTGLLGTVQRQSA
jgi:NAD(P)-dependent dehydrogenase (short-subunit alcohol dehydrogenase family)